MFFLALISLCHEGEVLDSLAAKPKTAKPLFSLFFYRLFGGKGEEKREKESGDFIASYHVEPSFN